MNVFKEGKAAYREKKAELKGERDARFDGAGVRAIEGGQPGTSGVSGNDHGRRQGHRRSGSERRHRRAGRAMLQSRPRDDMKIALEYVGRISEV